MFRKFLCLQCLSTPPQPMRYFTILKVRWELCLGADTEHRNAVHICKLSRVHPQALLLSEAVAMKIHIEGLDNFTTTILSHLCAA